MNKTIFGYLIVIITFVFALSLHASANLCEKWSNGSSVGALDPEKLPEASGLAISKKYKRLYHVNDGDDGPIFYITDRNGQNSQKIKISNYAPSRLYDVEDLALGRCGAKTCLFIANIGDNKRERSDIEIIVIEEKKTYGKSVRAKKVITAHYPGNPRNAEAMAVRPNGDILIVTKEEKHKKEDVKKTRVFTIPYKKWIHSKMNQSIELTYNGKLNIRDLAESFGYSERGQIIVSMDVSPDGERALLLTYEAAIEIKIEHILNPPKDMFSLEENLDYSFIDIPKLMQQEAIAYSPAGDAFLYTTEYKPKKNPGVTQSDIMEIKCLRPAS